MGMTIRKMSSMKVLAEVYQSKIDKAKKVAYRSRKEKRQCKRKRRKYNRLKHFCEFKIDCLRQDAHWKIAKDLTDTFSQIMIPRFAVSKMVMKENRNIHKTTVKNMLLWSHFAFRQRLIQKGELNGCKIHEVSEFCSTKTCGRCFEMNDHVGSSKTFTCPHCDFKTDRDWNAARNIFLMNYHWEIGRFQS